jgi:hypothetical protein
MNTSIEPLHKELKSFESVGCGRAGYFGGYLSNVLLKDGQKNLMSEKEIAMHFKMNRCILSSHLA